MWTPGLWVQQRVRDGSLEARKARGEVNPADLFTKHLCCEDRVTELLWLFGCRFAEGRAQGAPQLRRDAGSSHAGILSIEKAPPSDVDKRGQAWSQDGRSYPSTRLDELDGHGVPEAHPP